MTSSSPVDEESETVWSDEDAAPVEEEEAISFEPVKPTPCERCGRGRLYSQKVCDGCRQIERDAKFKADIAADLERSRRAFEESPHRCAGGCGEKMLREGQTCSTCEAKEKAERERDECVRSTNFTIPQRWKWASFEAPEFAQRVRDKAAIAKAIAACAPEIDRVIILGPPGAGKTTLAACVAKRRAHEGKLRGLYVTARDLMSARSQSELGSEARLVRGALGADLLIVDDLGLDDPQHHGSAVLDVVYSRFAEAKPTIFTLAISLDEIEPKYGGGFGRRLLEPAAGHAYFEVRRLGVVNGGAR